MSTATSTSTTTWASARCSPGTCILPCAVRSRPSSTTAASTSRPANSTPTWRSCSPSATACRCGGRPTRARRRRWTRSASRAGVTKREKLVKVEGGYHGHHDEVMISNKPPLDKAGPADAPYSVPQSGGITQGTIDDVIVIPYNDADALDRVLRTGDVAAFIVEPVMENIGICLPQPGYLEAVREITAAQRHAADLRRGEDRHHGRLRRRDRASSACSPTSSRSPSRSAVDSPSERSAARPSTWA